MLKIKLKNKEYDTNGFKKIIPSSFNQLITEDQPLEDNINEVEEWFKMYEELKNDISETGQLNSIEYIINKSGGFLFDRELEIANQELIQEINILQNELILKQQKLYKLQAELGIAQTNG